MELSQEQIERYSRQIILPEIGSEGQMKLLRGKVLVVGAGGLGSPACLYLAGAGVGTIGIVDSELVELSNLQRQVVYGTRDIGLSKPETAAERLRALNPELDIRTYPERLSAQNAARILADYAFVLDCTDSFLSKFLIADACHFAAKAYSHAGVLRFHGQALTVLPGSTCCYRCIFDQPPQPGSVPDCADAGILGPVAGVLGTIQATEAIKYLLGIGGLLTDRLLTYDALEMKFRIVPVRRSPACPLCGDRPGIVGLRDTMVRE